MPASHTGMSSAATWPVKRRPVSSATFVTWACHVTAQSWWSDWTSFCLPLLTALNETLQARAPTPWFGRSWSRHAGEETRLSVTYLTFMAVAMLIASIGVLLDQPILIVGAMVVGPEFGPLVAFCVSIVARRPRQTRNALGALVLGFLVGMAGTILFTWALTALGLVHESMLIAERPLTSFIWQPDALSWIVGFLAGVAGVLALTSAKSGALVGVLISVTTVPAAANAAVALAYWVPSEAIGSSIQLMINLASIVLAGVLTLTVQRSRQARLLAAGPAAGRG